MLFAGAINTWRSTLILHWAPIRTTRVSQSPIQEKMSCVTFYLIACLMVLTTVTCVAPKRPRVETVTNIGIQCRNRNTKFVGACIEQNLVYGELGCLNLVCAELGNDGVYKAHNTGRANDGTPCGPTKRCSQGVCVQEEETGLLRRSWRSRVGLVASQAFICDVPAAPRISTTTRKPTPARRPYLSSRT